MEVYVLVPLYKKGDKEWKEVCSVYESRDRAEKMGNWLVTWGNEEREDDDDDIVCLSYEIEERLLIGDW